MIKICGQEILGVAFDLEGTIVNLEFLHYKAHADAARSIGLDLDLNDSSTYLQIPHLIGGPDEAAIKDIIHLAQIKGLLKINEKEKFDELLILKRQNYKELFDQASNFPVREGFFSFLNSLKVEGLPFAIGSVTSEGDAHQILKRTGLDKLFDQGNIVLRNDVSKPKPDPDVYLETSRRMGIPSDSQLVFEDSHNGIRAAKEANSIPIGMPVINIPEIEDRMIKEGAVKIFQNWKDVSIDSLNSIEGSRSGSERKN